MWTRREEATVSEQPRNHPAIRAVLERVGFSPDGKQFYSCGADRQFKIWQMPENLDAAAGPKPEPGPAKPNVPPALARPEIKLLSAAKQANGNIIIGIGVSNWSDYDVLFQPGPNPPPDGTPPQKPRVSVKLLFDGQIRSGYNIPSAKNLESFANVINKAESIPDTIQLQVIDPRDQATYESEKIAVRQQVLNWISAK